MPSSLARTTRGAAITHHGFCIWMTGLPCSGKTTLAQTLAPLLRQGGWSVEILDGDEIRKGLSADLGYDRAGREAHAARVAFVAKVLARNGVVPIVALISPYATSRARARQEIGRFVEVYVSTPLAVCEQRDVKGLYRRARDGRIREMTGVDDPYEVPKHPEVTVDTVDRTPEVCAAGIIERLEQLSWISPNPQSAPVGRAPSPKTIPGIASHRKR